MSANARDEILQKLNAGEIHAGLPFLERIVESLGAQPRAAVTNLFTGHVSLRDDAFRLSDGDFAFLLVHEARHAQQGAADPLAAFRPRVRLERDADLYGCANTSGRIGYRNGAYGYCR